MPGPKKPINVVVADGVMQAIEQHAYSLLTAEVGGMLMGSVAGKTTRIEGFIPALSASAEQVTLTFTHDVWEDILKTAASDFPDLSIVGWYHTHPTFGVFLSDYDLFIQENFFSNPGNVALVIDPVQGKSGWFAKNTKGNVESFDEGDTLSGPKRSVDPLELQPATVTNNGAKLAFVAIASLLVGAAAGGGIIAAQVPPDLSETLVSAREETQTVLQQNQILVDGLEEFLSQPVITYRVREGDTLESVIALFYDDRAFGRKAIQSVNAGAGEQLIRPGELILIPLASTVGLTGWSASSLFAETGVDPRQPSSPDAPWRLPGSIDE